ncbi:MAG: hypothetical protein ABIP51_00460 [Bacteroidia bacterium]
MEGTNTTVEVEVKVKSRDQATGEMVDAVSTTTSITKTDAEGEPGDIVEEHLYINIKPGVLPNYADATISVNVDGKLTKADAG